MRIIDLTTVVMGPFATQILADMGADVVKVEPPEGDVLRHIAPMKHPGMGHIFLHHNRNKRSIVLDLKQAAGRAALLRLARDADVLIYNVRPQAMARLKLSYEEVRAANPRIIYVGAYGYGEGGRYAGQPAYDDLIQGMAGLPCDVARRRRRPAALRADRDLRPHHRTCRCQRRHQRAVLPRTHRQGACGRGADVRNSRPHGAWAITWAAALSSRRSAPPATSACWRRTACRTRRRTATCAC